MGRKLAAPCGVAALGFAAIFSCISARAAESSAFSVDCPELPAELRSSLEARGLADLGAYAHTDLRWRVTCVNGEATVESYAGNEPVRQSRVPLTGEPKLWVEQILAFLHEVIPCAEVRRALPSAVSSSAPAPPAAMNVTEPTPVPIQQERSAPARKVDSSVFDPALSVDTELWTSGTPLVLVGPTARLGIGLNSFVRIVPSFGAAWGSTRPSDMGVRLVAAGVDVRAGKRIWGSFGARLVWASFDVSSQFSPSSTNLFEPELGAKVGVTLPWLNSSLSGAIGVRAYARSHEVRVDGASALRMPLFAPTASIEYRFMPGG
jgi:hypothetical protein